MGFSNIFVKLSEKLEFMMLYRFMMKLILNGLSEIKVMTTCEEYKNIYLLSLLSWGLVLLCKRQASIVSKEHNLDPDSFAYEKFFHVPNLFCPT
jgi:hypothetical protein